jgi:two-component system, NarL family, sensor kinase
LWLYNPETDRFSLYLVYLDGEIIAALPETLDRLRGQWIWNGDLSRDLALKQHIVDRAPVLYDMNTLTRGQRRAMQQLGVNAMLETPLLLGSEIVGSFTICFPDPRELQPEELELAQALAHQATLATQLLKMATQAQQSAIVAERNRIARDIHDSLAQSLTGVVMQLNAATEFLTIQPQQTQACITRAQELAKQGLTKARRSVWLLYHTDSAANSLPDAIARLIEQMTTGTTVRIDLSIEGTPYCLDAPTSLNLLRIAQESLTNALRHANARTIDLSLSYIPEQVQLSVRDDGCGFNHQTPIRELNLLYRMVFFR